VDILQRNTFVLRDHRRGGTDCQQFALILQLTDFIDTQKTDLRVLPRHDEVDELYQRTVEHTDDKLRGDHHPEGDLTLDDSRGAEKHDRHVFDAFDKLCTQVLRVGNRQHSFIDMVEPRLDLFPFPPPIFFVIIDLDILYGRYGLHPIALVFGYQFEILPVQFLSDAEEQQHPDYIQHRPGKKYVENYGVIYQQYHSKKNKRQGREDECEGVVHDEAADAFVVLCPLQDITEQFVLKKGDRQLHQFDQVIGDKCDPDLSLLVRWK